MDSGLQPDTFSMEGASREGTGATLTSEKQLRIGSPAPVMEHRTPKPTNRERYENKPMPRLPKESAKEFQAAGQRFCIQPAIPLVDPFTPKKHRAVTDPLASKPLFSRRPSVSQLRRKMAHVKTPSAEGKQLTPMPTGKAAEVLGVVHTRGSHRHGTSSSPSDPIPRVEEASSDIRSTGEHGDNDCDDRSAKQFQGLHRTSREIIIDANIANGNAAATVDDQDLTTQSEKSPPSIAESERGSNKYLNVPKMPAYGKVGERPAFQDQKMVRVESVQGIIEHAESNSPEARGHRGRGAKALVEAPVRGVPPVSRSDASLQGVWENDPKVGYSLPPFSPAHHNYRKDELGRGESGRQDEVSFAQPSDAWNASPGIPNPVRPEHLQQASASIYTLPERLANGAQSSGRHSRTSYELPQNLGDRSDQLGSANSWANSPSRRSHNSTNGPISSLLPNHWPYHGTNSVPSPPQTFAGYERPDLLAASFSQLDMTIHHHLDKIFGHLSRMVADRSDRTLDQVLRRLDTIEDTLTKNHKSLKHDSRHINAELSKTKAAANSSNSMVESIGQQLDTVQAKVDSYQANVEGQLDLLRNQQGREGDAVSHHMAEVQGNITNEIPASGYIARGSARNSRSLSRSRVSKGSSRSHRSNTLLDGMRLHEPDIRQHPAYAGIPQPPQTMCDQNGVSLASSQSASQSLVESAWYQQAYGSH